jgi:hypothetical protein
LLDQLLHVVELEVVLGMGIRKSTARQAEIEQLTQGCGCAEPHLHSLDWYFGSSRFALVGSSSSARTASYTAQPFDTAVSVRNQQTREAGLAPSARPS